MLLNDPQIASGLRFPRADDLVDMVRYLTNGFVREDFGMRIRFGHRVGIIWPPRRGCRIAGLLKQCRPAIPTTWLEPETVNEHDWLQTSCIRALNLQQFVLPDRRWICGRCIQS